jgi:hypothetical protein
MKVMLIGIADREDGGYMCPMGVVVPCGTKTYQDAIKWLKNEKELVEKIIEAQCQDVYNDENEEYVALALENMTDFSYDYGMLHIDFEKDHYIYEVNLSMQFLNVYEKIISEACGG